MAILYICDRCGAKKQLPLNVVEMNVRDVDRDSYDWQLCDDCSEKLKAWIQNGNNKS